MLHGHAKLFEVRGKLLAALVVALDGVGRELAQLVGDPLGLGDLAGPHAGSLLVEYILQLYSEDFAVLVELLGTCRKVRISYVIGSLRIF